MSRARSRRRVSASLLGAVLVGGALGAVVLVPDPSAFAAPADFDGSFSGLATAMGVRVVGDAPNGVTKDPIDGSGPTAQSSLDSIGGSTGFAALPYPGEIAVGATGLAAGAAGPAGSLVSELPSYPFYAQSRFPFIPSANVNAPAIALSSTSGQNESISSAVGGTATSDTAAAFARSDTTVTSSPQAVVARANADLRGLMIGPLRIGEILSTAKSRVDAQGETTRSGDMTATGLSVEGAPVLLTDKGLAVNGATNQFPSTKDLTAALEQSGLTISIAKGHQTPNGFVSPALQIVQHLPNDVTVTYLVGQTSAAVDGTPANPSPSHSSGPARVAPGPVGVGDDREAGGIAPGAAHLAAQLGTDDAASSSLPGQAEVPGNRGADTPTVGLDLAATGQALRAAHDFNAAPAFLLLFGAVGLGLLIPAGYWAAGSRGRHGR